MKTQSQVENISEWLDIATEELTPVEKERISLEIKAHYADALETHLSESKNETEASFWALKELGNPYKAAKVYRKKYLTLKEDAKVYNVLTQPRHQYSLLVNCLIFFLSSFILIRVIPYQSLGINPYGFLVCSAITICIGLVVQRSLRNFKLLPSKHAAGRLLLIQTLEEFGSNILLAIVFLNFYGTFVGWIAGTAYCLRAGFQANRSLHIRSKFLRAIA